MHSISTLKRDPTYPVVNRTNSFALADCCWAIFSDRGFFGVDSVGYFFELVICNCYVEERLEVCSVTFMMKMFCEEEN